MTKKKVTHIIFKKERKLPVRIKVIGIAIFATFGCICVFLFFLSQNPEGSALFADNVLRPMIGSPSVIAVEGALFGVQDAVNKMHEHQPSKSNYQTDITTVPVSHSFQIIPPPNITPFVYTAQSLAEEGVWEKIAGTNLFTTFIRTDSTRPYAVVNLVYIPMNVTSIGAEAGIKYPGGTLGKPGTGMVPLDIQKSGSLIGAFNGGFQEKDGHYGMYANGVTYVPLLKDLATLYIYKDGHTALLPYDGKKLSDDVVVARQNGPFLVQNGKTSEITAQGIDMWAGTAKGDYVTWRSGVGINKNGDLIYAVGPSLTPTSLADALRLAGSVNAMQLDINAYWVRFVVYTWDPDTHSYTSSPLTKSLTNGGPEYLKGYEKDFFYLYKK